MTYTILPGDKAPGFKDLKATDGSLYYLLRNNILPDLVVTLDPHPTRIIRWFGDENLTKEESKALSLFNLNLPLTLDKIKKTYKKLVKIFHPDVNGNDKKAEEKFKEINNS